MILSGDDTTSAESLKARPEQQWGADELVDDLVDPASADFAEPTDPPVSPYLDTSLEHPVDRDPYDNINPAID